MPLKEQLLAISELKLAGKIERMNAEQLDNYAKTLKAFVEDFPEIEKNFRSALKAGDYNSFSKYFVELGEKLAKIHANDMAVECNKQIDGLKNSKPQKIEAFATYFLKSISMLSTDIQMAFKEILDKEQLLAISDLKLSGRIERMDEEQLNEYARNLILFIDEFPINEIKLKKSLQERNYEAFSENLTDLRKMLKKIYADELASECENHIEDLKNPKYEKIEAFIAYFLKSVSMLSIDIQMVKYCDKSKEKEYVLADRNQKKSAGEKSILAVDDTEFFLHMLKTFMQDTNYRLTCTVSCPIALNFLQKNEPDLFILDIEMPKMNGYELAQRIRECGQKAPIIFLTGSSTRDSVEKALRAGAADFIVKPITKDQLLKRITKFI
jgi:CheY-like chemotaxis protein